MNQTLSEQLAEQLGARVSTEPQATEAPEPELTPEPEAEGSQESMEASTASDEMPEEPEQGEESASEEVERYTPAKLAEAIGWEPKDLYETLDIPLGGDRGTITLGELKDKYDTIGAEHEAVEQQRKAAEQEREQFRLYAQNMLEGIQGPSQEVVQAMSEVERIKATYAQIDWNQLKANGGDIGDTKLQFSAALSQANQKLQQAQQQAQQAQGYVQQQAQQYHLQRLLSRPEFQGWQQKPEQMGQDMQDLSKFAVEQLGFAPQELPGIVHDSAIYGLWLAKKGYESMQAQSNATQTLRKAPKPVMRAGNGRFASPQNAQLEQIKRDARRPGATKAQKVAAAKAVFAQMQSRN